MTLLVRDEADIVETQIAFHRAAGVDFFVVTDHASSDGTTDILERYAAEGVLHLLRQSGDVLRQSEWVTRMARMAAVELGADWVINSDADEFWWPSGGDLKHVLSQIPAQVGVVRTFVRAFLPPADDGPFAERMTVRLSPAAPINDPTGPFGVNTRLLHRGAADVVVGTGNASVRARALVPLRGWSPVEVLHFPIRSFAHFERKFLSHYETVRGRRRGDHLRAWRAARAGRLRELYEGLSINEERLSRGLAAGSLTVDTRLRDALRALAASVPASLEFPRRDAGEAASYAVEQQVLDAGELVRLQRRADRLEQRLHAVERSRVRWRPALRALRRVP